MHHKLRNLAFVSTTYLFVVTLSFGAPAQPMAALKVEKGPYPSRTPQYVFATTGAEQEAQLKNNPLILRFAASRKKLASDPYRPAYHFVSPENMLNDPNGLCFWQGRWHLFYQAYPPDEFPDPEDIKKRRQHWGHAVSEDLVHWRDLPYAIYPGMEKMCFSGSTMVEEHRVVAFYPGIEAGQILAISSDPLLLNWDKQGPLNSGEGDADIWKEGDRYYGLIGDRDVYDPNSSGLPPSLLSKAYPYAGWPNWTLWSSKDLLDWKSEGELLAENTPFTSRYDDGACPNFEPIGDKHILLFLAITMAGSTFSATMIKRRVSSNRMTMAGLIMAVWLRVESMPHRRYRMVKEG